MNCAQTQQYLLRHDITPRKSLGQHFLCDEHILQQIVETAALQPDSSVLEIGPGLGVLTFQLAERVKHVFAVEFDRIVARVLQQEIKKRGIANISLIQADILHYSLEEFCREHSLSGHDYSMVSNLPYNISSRILRIFLETPYHPSSMTMLLQQEVAKRACAKPGDMSMLSVMVQAYSEPRVALIVPPESFWPEPEVQSAVLHLDVKQKWVYQNTEQHFFRVAKIGFSSRRKQLVNNFANGFEASKQEIISFMQEVGIDPNRRAETLTCEEWDALATPLQRFS